MGQLNGIDLLRRLDPTRTPDDMALHLFQKRARLGIVSLQDELQVDLHPQRVAELANVLAELLGWGCLGLIEVRRQYVQIVRGILQSAGDQSESDSDEGISQRLAAELLLEVRFPVGEQPQSFFNEVELQAAST